MISEEIKVANVKCSGCANSIQTKLMHIPGVSKVEVDIDNDTVNVEYSEDSIREELISKLHAMGYPEATEENGLLLQLKSYASCMIGRMNK